MSRLSLLLDPPLGFTPSVKGHIHQTLSGFVVYRAVYVRLKKARVGEMKKVIGNWSSRFSISRRRKITKRSVVILTLWLSMTSIGQVFADAGEQWTGSCVVGVEAGGGRGSNAAPAYCDCMANAAEQFSGDLTGLLAVMQAPATEKLAIYNTQSDKNKRIIGACAAKIEESFGAAVKQAPAAESNQGRGFWGDPEVVAAIRLINLNAAQAKVFKASATTYSNDLRTATAKIFRDKLDIKRKLKKKQRVLAKKMDAQVLEVLNKDQIEAYQAFSKTLDEKVKSFGRRKPRAS
jgi:hypothetical protein